MTVTAAWLGLTLLSVAPASPDRAPTPTAGPPPMLRSRGDGPLDPTDKTRRNAVVEDLLAAEAAATEDPQTAEPALQRTLRAFAEIAPLVADDDYAQSARTYAQLALARTRLVTGDRPGAIEALDTALRTARGAAMPVTQFGPSLSALYDERLAALAQQEPATLEVHCRSACRILVDERPFEPGPLPAGRHRVWIEAKHPGLPVLRREIDPVPAEVVTLHYDEAPAPEPAPAPTTTPPPPAPTPVRRVLPPWATGLGLGLGTLTAGGGGVLVGIDHRCTQSFRDPRRALCPEIYDTDAAGWTMVAVGSAIVVTSAVLLVVDEVRQRRAGRSARRSLGGSAAVARR
ncbi:MAG: hypothetical protein AAGF11_16900 [Myxococcota bacterium]